MRIATYNVAWFNALFDDDDQLLEDDGPSGLHGVSRVEQLGGLGIVFSALDADAVMVIEAPDQSETRSCVAALEGFAAHFGLRANRAIIGYQSASQQEIALLYDPDALTARHDPLGEPTGKRGSKDAPRFDGAFRMEFDPEIGEQAFTFARAPLEVAARSAAGRDFRMIGVHTKSKFPTRARNSDEARRDAVENRRKQFAQSVWIRQRVAMHLAAHDPLVVLGDFNDGPEIDEYEHLFPRSGVEVVLGWDRPYNERLYDRHAGMALSKRLAAAPVSARFQMPEGHFVSALLDYVMVSPDLRNTGPRWRIWHPFDDPVCFRTPELSAALLTASDHFPVTIDIDL